MSRLICVGGAAAGQFTDLYDPKHGMLWKVAKREKFVLPSSLDEPVPETSKIEAEEYRVNEFRGHHGDDPIFVLGPEDWSPTLVLSELLATYLAAKNG
jgi:hypothetical protein